MPNGKPGDHPLDDILDHHIRVYSEVTDALARQVAAYLPRHRLCDLFDWFQPPVHPPVASCCAAPGS